MVYGWRERERGGVRVVNGVPRGLRVFQRDNKVSLTEVKVGLASTMRNQDEDDLRVA